jgi:hypothetical protein
MRAASGSTPAGVLPFLSKSLALRLAVAYPMTEEINMKKLKGTYWQALYIVLSILALILAVGAPETTGW